MQQSLDRVQGSSTHATPKLLAFSASWHPIEGGAEKQLRTVFGHLAANGWRITVVAGGDDPSTSRGRGDGFAVQYVHRFAASFRPGLPSGFELMAKSLLRSVGHRPDVILASLVSAASLAAILFGKLAGVPVVLRLGGHDFERLSRTPTRRAYGRYLLSGTSLVVVNAPHLASQIGPFVGTSGTPQVKTIRNGVGHAFGSSPIPRNGRPGEPLRVIYYTNGGQMKNDPGFEEIVRLCPQVSFRAVGRTDHLGSYPNLERRGWRRNVEEELMWADVVLNTSFSEGSPNFCLQGLALRRPVVGYANEGIQDLAREYPRSVTTVQHGDAPGIVDVLLKGDIRERVVDEAIPSVSDVARQWDRALRSVILHA